MKNNILGVSITFLAAIFLFFVGIITPTDVPANRLYRVYLNGETIGLIASKADLLHLIDSRQEETKEKYNVNQVHPPRGLEIKEELTFSNDILKIEDVYDLIQDQDPFTISGYNVIIRYEEEELRYDKKTETGETKITKEPVVLNVLRKEDFEEAFINVIKAFVGPEAFELFYNDNQPEINDIGSKIEAIYWEENISIRQALISVDAEIFTSVGDISKYLFYGTLEEQETYIVKEGDNIESISATHNLNPDEFLVANPEFVSKNVLLTSGQEVNVGLIAPIVTIVNEKHIVEDIVDNYTTEYKHDQNAFYGFQQVLQEGTDGLLRVTEKVQYKNGEIHHLLITHKQELVPTTTRIVSRGTKMFGDYTHHETGGNESWSWPTNAPFIISSRFSPRWGTFHSAIDITGPGYGSPIRAVNSGVVTRNEFYGGFGWIIAISHGNGYSTMYSHLARRGIPDVGTKVSRGELIGYMGNSGRTTGTHLHFEVSRSEIWDNKNQIDPCKSIFSC